MLATLDDSKESIGRTLDTVEVRSDGLLDLSKYYARSNAIMEKVNTIMGDRDYAAESAEVINSIEQNLERFDNGDENMSSVSSSSSIVHLNEDTRASPSASPLPNVASVDRQKLLE